MSKSNDEKAKRLELVRKQSDIDYRFHAGLITAEQATRELADLLGWEKVQEMSQQHQDYLAERAKRRRRP